MLKDEIENAIEQRVKLHSEDYFGTQKIWDKEIEILSRDMNQTIKFIENDCDDETFCWIGEVFEYVAARTQSREFVDAIKRRAEKVVDDQERQSVEVDIRYAEYKL